MFVKLRAVLVHSKRLEINHDNQSLADWEMSQQLICSLIFLNQPA